MTTPAAAATFLAHGKQARQGFALVSSPDASLEELGTQAEGLRATHFEQTLESRLPGQEGIKTPSRNSALRTPISRTGSARIVASTVVALKFQGL